MVAPFYRFLYSAVPQRKNSEDSLDSKDQLLVKNEKDAEAGDIASDDEPLYESSRHNWYRAYILRLLGYAHIIFTIFLCLTVVFLTLSLRSINRLNPQITYSPAQDVIQYEARTFTSSLDYSKTEYQGPPSERNNAAWDALFVHGLTRVTAEEAAPMYNKTLPIPDDPDHYIVSLAVFHQLHCLNAIRGAVWNTTFRDAQGKQETSIRHLDHCVDMLRQAIMCHSDITPFVWARDPRDGRAKGLSSVTHTCRNFDAVREWAAERPFETGFNVTKPIERDPLGWKDHQFVMDFGEIHDWPAQEAEYDRWREARREEILARGPVGYEDRTTSMDGTLPVEKLKKLDG